MTKAFEFRALSPIHDGVLELDYLLRVVEAAAKYGYNVVQICGESNLDGFVEYRKFARANQVQDLPRVRKNREILQKTCKAAHQAGLKVYLWHHELWYPEKLSDVYPDWFVPAPDNRFRRDLYIHDNKVPRVDPESPFWEFMEAKFVEAFEDVPDLDATVMTIQESRVPIYCLYEDFDQQVDALVGLYQRLHRLHKMVNKQWVLRTFAWREHEYRVVTAAIERWRPTDVSVESKGVPMDWSLYYPYDSLLGRFDFAVRHCEVAPSCEFHGTTAHPVGHPRFYTENLRFAAERGHTGAILRIDRAGQKMLGGPDEGLLACVGAWLNNPDLLNLRGVYAQWFMDNYGIDEATARHLMYEMMERCWQATLHTYHHNKIYIGDAFWQEYDKLFWIAERDRCVEYTDPAPLAEKDLAVELAGGAVQAVERVKDKLPAAVYADLHHRTRLLLRVATSYRYLVAALIARQVRMYEPTAARTTELREAIDRLEDSGNATSREFPELDARQGGTMSRGQLQPGGLVQRFAQKWRSDLGNLPTRTILEKLTAQDLGVNALHQNQVAHQPGKTTLQLQGIPGGAKHVLVIFAGTQMCIRRPLMVSSGNWQARFDVGQYAWFLAHDRFRRYEAAIPPECFDARGRCTLELAAVEPENSPYISQVRLELESPYIGK